MTEYQLLDSGNGYKLEKFGNKTLVRPSSLAFWHTRSDRLFQNEWAKPDAKYDAKEQRWIFNKTQFSEWKISLSDFELGLKLQTNGQIGFFPDHYAYMPQLTKIVSSFKNPQVLNLFAYTGMASIVATQSNAHVTHIDSAKRCLDWTRTNFNLNNLNTDRLKLIPEDALLFLKRAEKRNLCYQVIIADPPAFYRPDKGRIWHLEQHFHELLASILKVLDPNGGKLFFTCHSFQLTVLKNLMHDYSTAGLKVVESNNLEILEKDSSRALPAGVYCLASY